MLVTYFGHGLNWTPGSEGLIDRNRVLLVSNGGNWDMPERQRRSIAAIVAPFTSSDIGDVYERLYYNGPVPKTQAAEFAGGEETCRELVDYGLATIVPHTPESPATFQAVRPDRAMAALLNAFAVKLATGSKKLGEAYEDLDAIRTELARESCVPEHLFEAYCNRNDILQASKSLINTASKEWMTLDTYSTDMPIDEDYDVVPPAGAQLEMRGIYERKFTETAAGRRVLEHARATGQEIRILPELPMKMQMADQASVLLTLNVTGTGGALLVHSGPIILALREYFEILWERAIPWRGSRADVPEHSPLTVRQHEVLDRLARGWTEDAIARDLEVSLKTVSRDLEKIAEELRAAGRFDLGVKVQRLGWLDGSGKYIGPGGSNSGREKAA